MSNEKGFYYHRCSHKFEHMKTYFIMFNIVFSIMSFSCLVSAADSGFSSAMESLLSFGQSSSASSTNVPTGGPGYSGSPLVAYANSVSTQSSGSATGQVKTQPDVYEGLDYYNKIIDPKTKAQLEFWAPDKAAALEEKLKGIYIIPKSSCPDPSNPLACTTSPTPTTPVSPSSTTPTTPTSPTTPTTNPTTTPTSPTTPPGSSVIKPVPDQPIGDKKASLGEAVSSWTDDLMANIQPLAIFGGGGALIGTFAGGKDGWFWGGLSGIAGGITYQLAMKMKMGGLKSTLLGVGVAALIFLLTYKKEVTKKVLFNCLPWQAPIGGGDCEKCNQYSECSEYMCKSLGQACDLVNKGTSNQKCVWKNPYDTNSPIISFGTVKEGTTTLSNSSVRKTSTGVEIKPNGRECIHAFTNFQFYFETNEPSQFKIDYNLTTDIKTAFDQMNFYVGGNNLFSNNHSEQLSLPGPDAINNAMNNANASPVLKNDGVYTLYIRCQDANGNFNQNAYSVRFCVEKGPDRTPPVIVNVSIPSGSPILFNTTELPIEVYVNEPSECKWSRDNRKYDLMEYNMKCSTNLWEMNNQNTYTCRTNLTGIESRKENNFYFRCKDQPGAAEGDRNVDTDSYGYTIIGTQPLNIIEVGPVGKIKGASDTVSVNLYIKTDNGYKNGEAICSYSTSGKESDYITFSNTGTNNHTQNQDLKTGDYTYYFKCIDLGGNADYNKTTFSVMTDTNEPNVIRTYKEIGELKIVTDKESECSYSNIDCNFEIDSGIKMSSVDRLMHFGEWKQNQNYFVRCKDQNNNQPDPNTCSIIIKASEYNGNNGNVISL